MRVVSWSKLYVSLLWYPANIHANPNRNFEADTVHYSFANDEFTSISTCLSKLDGISADEEWAMIISITATASSSCDFSTTRSATLDRVANATLQSIRDFQQIKSDVVISHIFCSCYITKETMESFINWIDSGGCSGTELQQLRCIEDRIESFSFDPLKSRLNYTLSGCEYNISRVKSLDVSEKNVGKGYATAGDYLNHLRSEHSYFYLELEKLPSKELGGGSHK